MGTDRVGITENFQNNRDYLVDKGIKLNCHEMFYREAFGPMHQIDVKLFDKLIDDFL